MKFGTIVELFIRIKHVLLGGFREMLLKQYKEILLFMLVYWIICLFMFFQEFSFLYLMLSWNALLAVLPLIFIKKSEICMEQGKLSNSIFWMIPWLFFFPNSVYLVTDFIHISKDVFIWTVEVPRYSLESGTIYSNDIMIWVKLLIIGVEFFFALLVGFESFYIFEKNIKNMTSKLGSFLGVLAVSFLSGLGVYIGRFLRFNSWDILFNPIGLISGIISNLDNFTIQFIFIFNIFIIGSYSIYRIFRRIVNS